MSARQSVIDGAIFVVIGKDIAGAANADRGILRFHDEF